MIRCGRLSFAEIIDLLERLSDQFEPPFLEKNEKVQYGLKLAQNAEFVQWIEDGNILAIVAYYTNTEEKYIYIPIVWVDSHIAGKGIAYRMMSFLHDVAKRECNASMLEVRCSNIRARNLYTRLGYQVIEDKTEKLLMRKSL